MPAKDQAAYMRDYRAKKKRPPQLEALAETFESAGQIVRAKDPVKELSIQLAAAQAEIRRLKQELARRPAEISIPQSRPFETPSQTMRRVSGRDPFAEVRPVPKTGKKK